MILNLDSHFLYFGLIQVLNLNEKGFGDFKSRPANRRRWFLLGRTDQNRLLFVVFTVRNSLIRVISDRDMSKKERKTYHEKIPDFKTEEEERDFWESHDSADFVDWKKAKKATFPNLKPTTRTISLRLPEYILDELKMLAHKRDVPYQSLIKIFLKDRINQELKENSLGGF